MNIIRIRVLTDSSLALACAACSASAFTTAFIVFDSLPRSSSRWATRLGFFPILFSLQGEHGKRRECRMGRNRLLFTQNSKPLSSTVIRPFRGALQHPPPIICTQQRLLFVSTLLALLKVVEWNKLIKN